MCLPMHLQSVGKPGFTIIHIQVHFVTILRHKGHGYGIEQCKNDELSFHINKVLLLSLDLIARKYVSQFFQGGVQCL